MDKYLFKDAFGWGIVLWVIGYVLGFIFFFIVPPEVMGWYIMPIGVLVTLWILLKKVHGNSFGYYLLLAAVWTIIAIVLDYLFIIKMLAPVGGYYKLDVYVYYIITFLLPLIAWGWKRVRAKI